MRFPCGCVLWWALLCAPPAFAQSAPAPVLIGAAFAQSGILADLAAGLREALLLWQDEINGAGGLNGRKVELKLLDDRSESMDAGRLYDQLIAEHKAELLIGPFGSAATLGAAAAAERQRRVLINGTGAAQKAGYRYVFQSAVPLVSYGAGALELARSQGLKRIVLLARDDPGAREMAARTREAALRQGFEVGGVETYPTNVDDFLPAIARARAAGAEAWIAFGAPKDAVEMVKAFQKTGYAPRAFVAQGAAQADFVARLGQAAEYAIGIAAYDRRARTRGNAGFVQAYRKKWSSEPGPAAAEGYAAAQLLAEAAHRAGSVDQEKLREALSALETETLLGAYKVDRTGAQVGAQALLTQVQRGRREVIWPLTYATAQWQPYPAWNERKPLQ
jgi:branched-chain amino acid transport system substrate-binding protein